MEGLLLEAAERWKSFHRLARKQKIPLVADKNAGRGRTAVSSVSARLAVGVNAKGGYHAKESADGRSGQDTG